MAETLGREVAVRNVEGAGGAIGAERVAKVKPDGNTVLLSNIGHATSVWLYSKLRYSPVEDFARRAWRGCVGPLRHGARAGEAGKLRDRPEGLI